MIELLLFIYFCTTPGYVFLNYSCLLLSIMYMSRNLSENSENMCLNIKYYIYIYYIYIYIYHISYFSHMFQTFFNTLMQLFYFLGIHIHTDTHTHTHTYIYM